MAHLIGNGALKVASLWKNERPHHVAQQVEVRREQYHQQHAQADQHVEQGLVNAWVVRHFLVCCCIGWQEGFFIGSPIDPQAANH